MCVLRTPYSPSHTESPKRLHPKTRIMQQAITPEAKTASPPQAVNGHLGGWGGRGLGAGAVARGGGGRRGQGG